VAAVTAVATVEAAMAVVATVEAAMAHLTPIQAATTRSCFTGAGLTITHHTLNNKLRTAMLQIGIG
tara:strand:- start:800 stop:997 length:198 start_codon:yes stop_codon:yes gene_type:complete